MGIVVLTAGWGVLTLAVAWATGAIGHKQARAAQTRQPHPAISQLTFDARMELAVAIETADDGARYIVSAGFGEEWVRRVQIVKVHEVNVFYATVLGAFFVREDGVPFAPLAMSYDGVNWARYDCRWHD